MQLLTLAPTSILLLILSSIIHAHAHAQPQREEKNDVAADGSPYTTPASYSWPSDAPSLTPRPESHTMYRASFAAGPDSESPTGGTGTGPTVTNSLVGDGQSGAPTSAVLTTVVTTNTEGEVVPVATKVGEVEGDGDGQGEEGETNSTSGTESAPRVMGLIAVFMVGLFYYW